jgi:hypothetical protein
MIKYLMFITFILGITGINYTAHPQDQIIVSSPETMDATTAAENFVSHINYARVAIAMKNPALAKQHIMIAKDLLAFLQSTTIQERRIPRVEAGQVVYNYETTYKYHYYPIQTGLATVKKVVTGPFWANNPGIAITDANVVYLTLDLTSDTAEKHLDLAENSLNQDQPKDADNHLAAITNSVVQLDQKEALPIDIASDNILLGRRFVAVENYDAARFALRHADTALDRLANAEEYKVYTPDIKAIKKELNELYKLLAKNKPAALKDADAKMEKWWNTLRSWVQ